ncbi:hypothetical protein [Sphingomonas sp. KR3-1]|uniref:hypothetical protein n=1 Tax=Sphingomonas sp. KR3-1 TaxID=3156611 RepID=UPI0032B5FDFB
MKRSLLLAALVPLAIAAIALPAWTVLTYEAPRPSPLVKRDLGEAYRPGKIAAKPTAAQIRGWQKLADSSCKCARRGGKSDECWAEYDRETAAYAKSDAATMCMPVSHVFDNFGEDKMVEIDRDHAGQLLCAAEERRAMEAAWNVEMARPHGETDAEVQRAFDRAGAAMDRVYRRILHGESLAGVRGPAGCSG